MMQEGTILYAEAGLSGIMINKALGPNTISSETYDEEHPDYEWAVGILEEFIKNPYVPTQPTQEEVNLRNLVSERQGMKCSRLQGRLVLGEATCDMIDTIAQDPDTPWAMRQTILNAIEWSRTSQAMTELGYLLGYTDEQMDELFRVAMTVEV